MFTVGKKPATGEYVGRPSPLGNPFYMATEAMRDEVCDKYENWFTNKVKQNDRAVMAELQRLQDLGQQRNVRLICFCAPRRCHADTIARYLNARLA